MANLAPGTSVRTLEDTVVLFWGVWFGLCVFKSPFCSAAHASHFGYIKGFNTWSEGRVLLVQERDEKSS